MNGVQALDQHIQLIRGNGGGDGGDHTGVEGAVMLLHLQSRGKGEDVHTALVRVGTLTDDSMIDPSRAVEIAGRSEVKPGEAVILSNIAGDEVKEYRVEITHVYTPGTGETRNLMLKVTDPELLEQTGGIVQGMSGSPIIQDGKLVGAVTHVLVNDPTRGYGIFIEIMLEAAGGSNG